MNNIIGISRVALDVPLRRLFDYRVPEGAAAPLPGTRVRVPFGRQSLIGVVMEHAAHSPVPEARLKPLGKILDAAPVVSAPVLDLVRWASDYYHHPIGEVLASALPKALRSGASPVALEEIWRPTPAGREALGAGRLRRSRSQRQVLELLIQRDPIPQAALAQLLPRWRAAATALVRQGWALRETVTAHSSAGTAPPSRRRCTTAWARSRAG